MSCLGTTFACMRVLGSSTPQRLHQTQPGAAFVDRASPRRRSSSSRSCQSLAGRLAEKYLCTSCWEGPLGPYDLKRKGNEQEEDEPQGSNMASPVLCYLTPTSKRPQDIQQKSLMRECTLAQDQNSRDLRNSWKIWVST